MSANRRKTVSPPTKPAAPERRTDLIVIAVLLLCTFAVYARIFGFDFVNFDDDLYMYENPVIRAGLSLANLKWALTAVVASNWMPVTLISHMLDAQLFGVHAGPQHLVSVAIHALAAVFLFLALRRATGIRWLSAFAAMAFAVHPLHVESVAWIAERKDVLSALFWFSGLYAYVRYAEQPSRGRYLAVAGLFALGLMSKPMMVTFPFTLLLFDVWPLRRFEWPKSVIEKLPMFALTAIAAVVSYLVQDSAGATRALPFGLRLENALISVLTYLWQTLWPTHLAVFYPYTAAIPGWQVALAVAIIAGVSWIAIRNLRTRPWLAVGWFWFLGTLVPVIGLVQVGNQAHADRYMYVPMVGLTLMLAGVPSLRREVVIAGAALCAIWMVLTFQQTAYWRNSQMLYEHAIEATSGNWLAEYNLGHYLMDEKRTADAIPHFEAVLRIRPEHYEADNNLGSCLMFLGRKADAVPYFEAALRAKPDFADAHFNLGLDLMALPGRTADAETELKAALRYAPEHEQAHNSLGLLLFQTGRSQEAVPHFEAITRLHPSAQAEYNLGAVLATLAGRQADAIKHLEASERLSPNPQTEKLIEMLQAGGK
jgi:Flp pilus assembly protein TadD